MQIKVSHKQKRYILSVSFQKDRKKNSNNSGEMSKGTSIKEALKKWEEKNKQDPVEATDIGLQFQWPPIDKMDNALSSLRECQ